jgi:hypothetical protein
MTLMRKQRPSSKRPGKRPGKRLGLATVTGLLFLSGVFLGPSACIEEIEPDTGPLQVALCVNDDSDPSEDVSFRDHIVAEILNTEDEVACLQCHAPDAPTPLGFEVSGLDLSSYEAAARGGANSDGTAIIPGQPCQSIAYQKVSPGPPFGARMPLSGPPYLNERQLQLLHDWIAEGAKNN